MEDGLSKPSSSNESLCNICGSPSCGSDDIYSKYGLTEEEFKAIVKFVELFIEDEGEKNE